jgi:hypothetical protein
MRAQKLIFAFVVAGICAAGISANDSSTDTSTLQRNSLNHSAATKPQPRTLCTKDERVIFSCPVKRPAKIVSVCASKDMTSDRGYLQYRFGLPGKIELEYPKDRKGSQEKFQYTHYFRARVDLTEINFNIDGYEYQVFDTYQGEEKPAITEQGVNVTAPGKPKQVSFVCRAKPIADYTDLQAVLSSGQE